MPDGLFRWSTVLLLAYIGLQFTLLNNDLWLLPRPGLVVGGECDTKTDCIWKNSNRISILELQFKEVLGQLFALREGR